MAEHSVINIVSVVNRSYLTPFSVAVHSLIAHCTESVRWFVIENDLPEDFKISLAQNIDVHWIKSPRAKVSEIQLPPRFGIEVYYSLLLGNLLPDLDRVLFLDADLLVLDNVGKIWDRPISHKTVAAAVDMSIPTVAFGRGVPPHLELGIPSGSPVFNVGVMDVNLQRWRDLRVGERTLQYLRQRGKRVSLAGQEALNATLWDDWECLPLRWNVTAGLAGRRFFRSDAQGYAAAVSDPGIAHFSGYLKPWKASLSGVFQGVYEDYLREQPYVRAQAPNKWTWEGLYDSCLRPLVYPLERFLWERGVF